MVFYIYTKIWNYIPHHIRTLLSFTYFKKSYKQFLLNSQTCTDCSCTVFSLVFYVLLVYIHLVNNNVLYRCAEIDVFILLFYVAAEQEPAVNQFLN